MEVESYIMKTFIFIFWFILSIHAYGQSVYKIRMTLERVPINHTFPVVKEQKTILIVTEGKYFGLYTGYDTLYLEATKPLSRDYVSIYRDVLHDNQLYYIIKVKTDLGFSIFLVPIKPYLRPRLWGISLMSI